MLDCLNAVPLTNLTEAGGCGCKLDASSLQVLLEPLRGKQSSKLIRGFESSEDCAIVELNNHEYQLFTTDFFTPLIDDLETFGSLAAAHALSDIYAKGGTPYLANVILGFDPKVLSMSVMQQILTAGKKILNKHGCSIGGGHTIINPQPIYGFSILGRVPKKNLKSNNGAKNGDVLLLTKPLGSGIFSSALKLGLVNSHDYEAILPLLLEVNCCGKALGLVEGVHAMTDVTGFGLIGHALEMIEGSSLALELDAHNIECLNGMMDLIEAVVTPESGMMKNYHNTLDKVSYKGTWKDKDQYIYSDPQTNGGLLIAVSPDSLSHVHNLLYKKLGREVFTIGRFMKRRSGRNLLEILR